MRDVLDRTLGIRYFYQQSMQLVNQNDNHSESFQPFDNLDRMYVIKTAPSCTNMEPLAPELPPTASQLYFKRFLLYHPNGRRVQLYGLFGCRTQCHRQCRRFKYYHASQNMSKLGSLRYVCYAIFCILLPRGIGMKLYLP